MQSVYIKFFLTGVPLAILIASFVFPHIKIDTNVLIILLFAFLPWLPELVTKLKLGNFAQLETVHRRSTDDAKQAGTPGQSAPRTTTGPANHIAPTPGPPRPVPHADVEAGSGGHDCHVSDF